MGLDFIHFPVIHMSTCLKKFNINHDLKNRLSIRFGLVSLYCASEITIYSRPTNQELIKSKR